MKELGAAILLLCLVSGCGGGGGGSSAPPTPPPPSVNISGNAGSYWIDEEIEIRFSTSNMDRNTISYTVSNFEEGYDFTLDSSNGVFKTITGQFTDPGEYSLTVTATDGAGKTASRSFQFDVHTVITGRVEVEYQNDGRLPYARVSRDGNFAVWQQWGSEEERQRGVWQGNSLLCNGMLEVDIEAYSGVAECRGKWPSGQAESGYYVGLRELGRIEIEGLNTTGTVRFYEPDGSLLETWTDVYLSTEDYEQNDVWPTNNELIGTFIPVGALLQYDYSIDLYEAISEADSRGYWPYWQEILKLNWNERPQFKINNDYTFSTVMPPEGASACNFTGQLNEVSLDEYAIVHGVKGGTGWQRRMMGMSYAASGCDGFGDLTGTISLNQSSGGGVIETSWFTNSDGDRSLYLYVHGPGDDRPFTFWMRKICEGDGTPTAYNTEIYGLSCS